MNLKGVDIDTFTVAYLQCVLFAETDNSDDNGGEPLDRNYDLGDFTVQAIEVAKADCEKFQADNLDDILKTPDWHGSDSYTCEGYLGLECAGHDFWFTRNGHGVGFWDKEYYTKEEKNRLTKAAEAFGECSLYITDSNEIDFM
jgi:hypothetical protein